MKARGKYGRGKRAIKPAAAPRLLPLDVYHMQRKKLLAAIDAVERTPTMQGQAWKDGQLRHFRKLLAELDANKPA